jgi:hypothetical protein
MPAAFPHLLPAESNPAIRQGEAWDLRDSQVVGALEQLVEVMEPGPAREVILATVYAARPDVLREVRKREAARLVEQYLAEGCSKTTARERAAPAVGVSTWQLRVVWGL